MGGCDVIFFSLFRTNYEAGLQTLGPLLSDALSDIGDKSAGMLDWSVQPSTEVLIC